MHCSNCGIQVTEGASFCQACGARIGTSPSSMPSEIREVKLDLQLPDGSYPTYYWIERTGPVGILRGSSGKVVKKWWEPSHFSHEHLRKLLLDEINKWLAEGWELVETDLDDVWLTKHGSKETVGSTLAYMFRIPAGLSYKEWRIYYGARFRVRRSR